MATNAKDVYADLVSKLPPKERLRLAAMILNDLTNPADPRSINLIHGTTKTCKI